MTGDPLRPEEERSLEEATREIDVPPGRVGGSPHDRAAALVNQWEGSMGSSAGVFATIVMTNDVRDAMIVDITKLLEETVALEHTGTAPAAVHLGPSELENELVGILAEHVSETGENEGAVDVLKRIVADHDHWIDQQTARVDTPR